MAIRYCQCGCGETTPAAAKTNSRLGWVKGEPMRFASPAHRNRWIARNRTVDYGPEYAVEDRGYSTPCWTWLRGKQGDGYASNGLGLVHRVKWIEANGPVPEGHELDHLCRHRDCVNPDHLQPVLHELNVRRGNAVKHPTQLVAEVRALHRANYRADDVARAYGITPGQVYHFGNRPNARPDADLITVNPHEIARAKAIRLQPNRPGPKRSR